MPNRAGLPGIDLVTGVSMCAVKDSEGRKLLTRDARGVGSSDDSSRHSDLVAMLTRDVHEIPCLRWQGL